MADELVGALVARTVRMTAAQRVHTMAAQMVRMKVASTAVMLAE